MIKKFKKFNAELLIESCGGFNISSCGGGDYVSPGRRVVNMDLKKASKKKPRRTHDYFCTSCDEKLLDGSKFCHKCGTLIDPPIEW